MKYSRGFALGIEEYAPVVVKVVLCSEHEDGMPWAFDGVVVAIGYPSGDVPDGGLRTAPYLQGVADIRHLDIAPTRVWSAVAIGPTHSHINTDGCADIIHPVADCDGCGKLMLSGTDERLVVQSCLEVQFADVQGNLGADDGHTRSDFGGLVLHSCVNIQMLVYGHCGLQVERCEVSPGAVVVVTGCSREGIAVRTESATRDVVGLGVQSYGKQQEQYGQDSSHRIVLRSYQPTRRPRMLKVCCR